MNTSRKTHAARSRSHALPSLHALFARGGVRGEQSSLSRSGAGVYSAGTAASVYAAPPPPPTPPRRFAEGGE